MAERELLQQLADIELPPPPNYDVLGWSAIVVVAILIAVAIAWQRRYEIIKMTRPPKSTALRKLREIEKAWRSRTLTDREAAFQLATVLRLGLGLAQLTSACPTLIQTHREHWAPTIALLEALRYPPQAHRTLTPQLFGLIGDWLASAARPEDMPVC